jgi:exonuclease III
VISWNVNGLSDSKVYLHDLYKKLTGFDVILLTETRLDVWDDHALPGHWVAFIPARQPGQAGEGFVVAVRRSTQYVVTDWGSSDTTLWVRIQFLDGSRLVVGACYIPPPQGSPQLHHNDLNARMVKLSSDVLAATHEGYVLIVWGLQCKGWVLWGVFSRRCGDEGLYGCNHQWAW